MKNIFRKWYFWGILILLIGGLSYLWLQPGLKDTAMKTANAPSKKALYQCSMHPQIISHKPENCPICGMRLTRIEEAPEVRKETITTQKKILYYRHPMRPEITSMKPAKDEMGMDYIPVYEGEESGVTDIEVPGHADVFISPERQQLIGVETTVTEEMPLVLTIRAVGRVAYDPELYNTLTEHKEAMENYKKLQSSPLPGVRERAEALLKSADLKLKLLGINQDDLAEIMKLHHGDGTNLLLPSETAWVYAEIYEYETGLIKSGQTVKITSPSLPRMHFEGTVKTVDPILNAMTRTLRVRIATPNPDISLKPEMFVDVGIEVPLGTKLVIPEDALFTAGETQLVFVDKGEGRIEPRQVRVGYEAGGYYEVLEGLKKNERVVSSANFLIDSESRLRAAVKGFGGVKKEASEESSTEPHTH